MGRTEATPSVRESLRRDEAVMCIDVEHTLSDPQDLSCDDVDVGRLSCCSSGTWFYRLLVSRGVEGGGGRTYGGS